MVNYAKKNQKKIFLAHEKPMVFQCVTKGNKSLNEYGIYDPLLPFETVEKLVKDRRTYKMSEENKNKPVAKTRLGSFQISKWEKVEGDKKTYSFSVQKSWKKKDSEEWESQSLTLFPEELSKLSACLCKAYEEHFITQD